MKLTPNQKRTLTAVLILTLILVYSPHLANPFPNHIDEWRHITETIKLKQGEYSGNWNSVELGFHIFLLPLSILTNIVLFYKFLPAIWAIFSALTLFYIIKNKTSHLKKSFLIAIFSIIFFASIKSNANITGLWFFTPLTFSIPFIFLYIYLFSEGMQKQNKKYILSSFIIMILLIPTHAISVLFAIPALFIFSLFHLNYIKKQYKFFSIFLLIPLIGIFFHSQLFNLTLIESIKQITTQLQFKLGFGVLELNNSFFELYSPIGYLLAILGTIYIITSKRKFKHYLIYFLLPITLLINILIFKQTGISYLSPYQRNLYYLAISLPFLSALGLYYLLILLKKISKKEFHKIITIITIIIVIIFTFASYYSIPNNIKLYKTINNDNYQALKFISLLEPKPSTIMAPASISTAIFPITQHKPVGTIFFYGNRADVESFFRSEDCDTKNQLIEKHNVKYILSENNIKCNWTEIYNKNNNFVYKINN